MVQLIIVPEAKEELREAAAFYQNRREGLGPELLQEACKVIDSIRENPLRHGYIEPPYRWCRISRFPYGMIYRLDEEDEEVVYVVAVMHFKRRPGYWRERDRR